MFRQISTAKDFTSHRTLEAEARTSTDKHGQARTGTRKPHTPHEKGPGPKVSAHQRHERATQHGRDAQQDLRAFTAASCGRQARQCAVVEVLKHIKPQP